MKTKRFHQIYLLLAYFAIYVIWGTTYLANLYSLEGFKPFTLSGFRYIIAGVILFVWCLLKEINLPSYADIRVLSISGIFMLVGGSGLIVYAEQYINSGYTAVLVATEPLWFIILDRRHWRQYFSNLNIILGILIGFTGIALFVFYSPHTTDSLAGSDQLKGTVIVLLSSVLWVIGTLYGRKGLSTGNYTVLGTVIQLFAAGIVSLLIATFVDEWISFSFEKVPFKAWAGLGYLVFFGSIIAYLAFNWLVTVQPPALVSTHTYANPVVAIIIGWLVANELIVGMQLVALAIVFAGILLAQLSGFTKK